jgi:hypothetical protein
VTRITVTGADKLAAALEKSRKDVAKALRRELSRRAEFGGGPPPDESEDSLHLRMANHLHALFPGANPRIVQKAAKAIPANTLRAKIPARPAIYEPPHPWATWWHTPNQGNRSAYEGDKFRRMGMRKGFSDFGLGFTLDLERFAGTQMPTATVVQLVAVEVKAGEGRLKPEQERFRDDCRRLGVPWAECRSVRELDTFLRDTLRPWGRELPSVRIWE